MVLGLAYERAFSQFPVVVAGKFRGVITENEVIRWLGQQVSRGHPVIDTAEVSVQTVLEQVEPDRPAIFRFVRLDASEQEVMGMFQRQPALEVVMLTESGDGNTPLGGILTQWDAARYPGVDGN
jgi:predicted transcriptional regulator